MTDAALKRVARELRAGILGRRPSVDMCMAVSAPLEGLLRSVYGVACKLEVVWFDETPQGTTNHVFLRLSDGRILDATADQFGLEAIYLGHMPAQYQAWMEAFVE